MYSMDLGQYIELLEKADPDKKIANGLGNPHSWRGSYCELAFEPIGETTVGEMLAEAKKADGAEYTGWKGGEYLMDRDTTINIERKGEYTDGGLLFSMLFELMLTT